MVILSFNTTRFFYGWLAVLVLTVLSLSWQLYRGIDIQNNVLDLLPGTERDPVVQQAVQRFNDHLAKQHLLLVGAKNREQARQAARFLFDALEKSAVFPAITFKLDNNQHTALFNLYSDYRATLLSPTARHQLSSDKSDELIDTAIRALYNPLTPVSSGLLESDPLLLFYDYLNQLPVGSGAVQPDDGLLMVRANDWHYVMLRLQLPADAHSLTVQQQVVPLLEQITRDVKTRFVGSDLISMGVVRYAHAGVQSARHEISTIGAGSLAGVVLLLALVFRSGVPMLASLVAIIMGFAAALSACLWVFGSVHILTLVFGAGLIGISIDYSFHFFADWLSAGNQWQARGAIERIFNGISLGLVTSLIGFMGLCIAPFPGMQQMAVFSCVGLVAAYLTVIGLFPLWVNTAVQTNNDQSRWVARVTMLLSAWQTVYRRLPAVVWLTAIAIVILAGLQALTSNDDIRLLQSVPQTLAREEQRLKTITGDHPASEFFLIEGDSEQAVLEREEMLVQQLNVLQQKGALSGFNASSSYLPSAKRQRENYQWVKQQLIASPTGLEHYRQRTGMDNRFITALKAQYQQEKPRVLTPALFSAGHGADFLNHLSPCKTIRGYASIVTLQGLSDRLSVSALQNKWPQVHFIDQVSDISAMFKQYRERASELVLLSYAVIYFFLLLRYGMRGATAIMMPAAMAAVLTIALLALLGEALNIFHSLALLLVLGIGIDYTLFLQEGSAHRSATMLAIVLSAMTTVLSFGLLALSDTAAIHAFGVTVLIGISVALLLSPLVIELSEHSGQS